jgi:hypothetical protein
MVLVRLSVLAVRRPRALARAHQNSKIISPRVRLTARLPLRGPLPLHAACMRPVGELYRRSGALYALAPFSLPQI